MRASVLMVIAVVLLSVSPVFGQNAQLGGSVTDSSGALLPGVTITATNTETGVETTAITNEAGTYNFPSLQPGRAYTLSAMLPGFQTTTFTNVDLGPTAVRRNFQLQVSAVQTVVEVSADPLNAISTTSASVGDVLNENRINDLPIVGNNVLSFLNVLPGLRISAPGAGGLSGPQLSTINGLGLDSVSVTRDGLTQNDTRFSAAGDVTGGPIPHGGGIAVMSPTTIIPDLVGEVRLILSPVDAELGRGNSQIQVQTRSGTNTFNGAVVWNGQNSALNANTWDNNRQVNPQTGAWSPRSPDWRNVHQYTASYGGPIVKNKTFFFALWDQNISYLRQTIYAHVLTKEARQGIFRFWEGWSGRSADPTNNPTSFVTAAAAANPTIVSVDLAGKPLRPPSWPDGTPYTGRLVCISVFGRVKTDGSAFTQADCPSGVDSAGRTYTGLAMFPTGASWDPRRPSAFDNRGYFAKVLAAMPEANNFFHVNGDGLTMGVHQWNRTRRIGDPTFYNETLIGNDPYSNRKQLNIKIDHNLRVHRISGSWSYQMDDNVVLPGEWPGGVQGVSYRRPQTFGVGVTSTLSSTLLNEARFGYRTNKGSQIPPWEMSDSKIRDQARQYLAEGGVKPGGSTKYPVLVRAAFPLNQGCTGNGAGATSLTFDNGPMGTRLNCGVIIPNLLDDPLFQYVNNVSWTRGKHAFKFGGDVRLPRTNGYAFQPYVNAPYGNLGGTATLSPIASETAGTGTPQLGPTLLPAGQTYATAGNIFRAESRTQAANLAYLLTESIGALNTPYWIESQADKDAGIAGWKDITTQDNRYRKTISSDYAFFVKDDYKVSQNLTLNLGVRYEYFSPPYLGSGLTVTTADLGDGMFGASRGAGGKLFDNWLQPGNLFLTNYGPRTAMAPGAIPLECRPGVRQSPLLPESTCDPNTLTTLEFVGPETTNSSKTVIPRDRMNFGPAIGFAWQVPWFGAGKTTVRGGYSVQYQRISIREDVLAPASGGNTRDQVATTFDADIAAIIANRAINFGDLATLVPRRPDVAPGLATPVYARGSSFTAYDPNLTNPYVQNLTLSVTRTLSRNSTLDVRYVGTLARKQLGGMDLNTSTVMYNPELLRALEVTRRGGDDPLFDQMFAGIRLSGVPATVPVVNGTTSRGSEQLRQSTATRANLANGNFVNVANALFNGQLTIAAGASGVTGLSPGPAFAILHNGCDRLATGQTLPATRCFPENYLTANPQLNGATYIGNLARSNYHALQTSYTLRPTLGFSVQTTYSWAKSMQLSAGAGPALANAGTTGGAAYTDPLMRDLDRARGLESLHSLRSNGTIELPIGPGKLFFSNASGLVARLIEGWQTSFILNMGSGVPINIGGAETMRYGNARYVVASPLWEIPEADGKWDGPGGNTGTLFGDKFVNQRDPQCSDTAQVASSLAGFCTLQALAMRVPANTPGAITLADGTSVVHVLINPKPGEMGTLGLRSLDSFGTFFLDGNIQKTFRISERKQLSLRVDATNILNHPQLNNPGLNVNPALNPSALPFGSIAGKGAASFTGPPVQRNFQAQVRLTF